MTLVDVPPSSPDEAPSRPRRLRWIAGVLVALVLAAGGVLAGAVYYYDDVPAPGELNLRYPVVRVADLPLPVGNAFTAAADPDFYQSEGAVLTPSPITRRYAVLAAGLGAGEESTWRVRVMASKLEDRYTRAEILGFYLNAADYGRGAAGLVAAARTYFDKPAAQLTVAEAALLAVLLDPDRPELKAGWGRVLDTMVERGWLSRAERDGQVFPG